VYPEIAPSADELPVMYTLSIAGEADGPELHPLAPVSDTVGNALIVAIKNIFKRTETSFWYPRVAVMVVPLLT
jgi:hypothetical protein